MSNAIMNLAMKLIENNPNIANNPRAKEMIDVIKNNDQKRGEEIAHNLCKTYGVPEDQAVSEARKFFNV